ncbi:MAG TPA: GTP cyclohydrolase II [Nautiliaceae bacterium]|nr:GTP cyclohydrolase II [Nautiliaceae bacterium]
MEISNIASLPTKYGDFKIQSFKENNKEHLVILTPFIPEVPYVRIHSECLTGDALGSLKCDCGEQLEFALKTINKEGGFVIYLRQEGRGIGLFNKVNAYALQDKGLDTVEANHQLGFEADMRDFSIVEKILKHFNIKQISLLTNNPKKEFAFKETKVIKRVPIRIKPNPFNKSYLKIKKEKLGHKL